MNAFRHKLDEAITEAIERDTSRDTLALATELLDNIGRYENDIKSAKQQISHLIEQINASLGMEIRKRQPKMMVAHRNGSCSCGYRSNDLTMQPDLSNKCWSIGGTLGSRFVRRYPQILRLDGDVNQIADAITDFFKQHYRTLG